jgi:hypothetical protein
MVPGYVTDLAMSVSPTLETDEILKVLAEEKQKMRNILIEDPAFVKCLKKYCKNVIVKEVNAMENGRKVLPDHPDIQRAYNDTNAFSLKVYLDSGAKKISYEFADKIIDGILIGNKLENNYVYQKELRKQNVYIEKLNQVEKGERSAVLTSVPLEKIELEGHSFKKIEIDFKKSSVHFIEPNELASPKSFDKLVAEEIERKETKQIEYDVYLSKQKSTVKNKFYNVVLQTTAFVLRNAVRPFSDKIQNKVSSAFDRYENKIEKMRKPGISYQEFDHSVEPFDVCFKTDFKKELAATAKSELKTIQHDMKLTSALQHKPIITKTISKEAVL